MSFQQFNMLIFTVGCCPNNVQGHTDLALFWSKPNQTTQYSQGQHESSEYAQQFRKNVDTHRQMATKSGSIDLWGWSEIVITTDIDVAYEAREEPCAQRPDWGEKSKAKGLLNIYLTRLMVDWKESGLMLKPMISKLWITAGQTDLMNWWQPPAPRPDSQEMNFNWCQHTFVRGADFNGSPQMEELLHFPSFHIQGRCFRLAPDS